MPDSSAIRARRSMSSHSPDHIPGALLTNFPDEQFAPKNPSFSLFWPNIANRSAITSRVAIMSACFAIPPRIPAT